MADLNGDGHEDLYTGSYGGVIYVLYGSGKGQFERPEVLLNSADTPLCLGKYYDTSLKEFRSLPGSKRPDAQMLSASAVDWDADGDLDLVVGENDGRILLLVNDGTRTEPSFQQEPTKIRAGRKSLWIESGHSMPVARDWDGDGLFDIVSGSNGGAVYFWRNTGKEGEPLFAKRVALLEDPEPSGATGPLLPARPMTRTQPHIGDLDGDGRPELLIGESRRIEDADGKLQWHGLVWAFQPAAD